MSEDTVTVRIDLDAEVLKMADADGVKDPALLKQPMQVTRYERYAEAIRNYYKGKDDGYAEGVVMMGRPINRRMRKAFVYGAILGSVVASLAVYFGVRILHVAG